jgi:hypothetical protein
LTLVPSIVDATYDPNLEGYPVNNTTYISFTDNDHGVEGGYYYRTGTVASSLSWEELKTKHLVLMLRSSTSGRTFYIRDFRIFRYINSGNG